MLKKKVENPGLNVQFYPLFVQIQKRSGAWFYKGRDQQLLPSPLPLSTPPHSRSSHPGGHVASRSAPVNEQLCGSLVKE